MYLQQFAQEKMRQSIDRVTQDYLERIPKQWQFYKHLQNLGIQEQSFTTHQKLLLKKTLEYDPTTRSCGYLQINPCSQQQLRYLLRYFIDLCERSDVQIDHWLMKYGALPIWQRILEHVSTANCKNIFFSRSFCKYPYAATYVQRHLARIHFPQLQKLKLLGDQILSIQMISFLDAPNLEVLEIQECPINSIKPLTKCHFKKLRDLKILLEQNATQSNDFSSLSRLTVSQESFGLKTAYDIYNVSKPRIRLLNFEFLLKLPCQDYEETGDFVKKIIKDHRQDIRASLKHQKEKFLRLNQYLTAHGKQFWFDTSLGKNIELSRLVLRRYFRALNK